jgi:hypothetical protein
MAFPELQELVDAPNESLSVEYKSWMDMNSLRCGLLSRDILLPSQTTGAATSCSGLTTRLCNTYPIRSHKKSTGTSSHQSSRNISSRHRRPHTQRIGPDRRARGPDRDQATPDASRILRLRRLEHPALWSIMSSDVSSEEPQS